VEAAGLNSIHITFSDTLGRVTDEDYDWDLEPPSEESEWGGPLYDDELRELERALDHHYTTDISYSDRADWEEVEMWEERVDLATKQMVIAMEVEGSEEFAENAYETGLMMIHDTLDDFGPEYIDHPVHSIDSGIVGTLREAYREAYDQLQRRVGSTDRVNRHDLGRDLPEDDLGGDLGGNTLDSDLGGNDLEGNDLGDDDLGGNSL
jgi:hypothetical protein